MFNLFREQIWTTFACPSEGSINYEFFCLQDFAVALFLDIHLGQTSALCEPPYPGRTYHSLTVEILWHLSLGSTAGWGSAGPGSSLSRLGAKESGQNLEMGG